MSHVVLDDGNMQQQARFCIILASVSNEKTISASGDLESSFCFVAVPVVFASFLFPFPSISFHSPTGVAVGALT